MVSKQTIFTAAGVIMSFVIAIGGWLLTSWLIDIKSDEMLSATNVTFISVPERIATAPPADKPEGIGNVRPILTEQEIVSILRNWESSGRERLHEPAPEHISMEQAIEAGKEGLSFLSEHFFIPEELLSFSSANAYLYQNQTHPGEEFLAPEYSYWGVVFKNDSINVNMTVNAVTGQVWKVEVRALQMVTEDYTSQVLIRINQNETGGILAAFMSGLGLDSSGEAVNFVVMSDSNNRFEDVEMIRQYDRSSDEFVVSVSRTFTHILSTHTDFADGTAVAVVKAAGILSEEGELYTNGVSIYLSARVL